MGRFRNIVYCANVNIEFDFDCMRLKFQTTYFDMSLHLSHMPHFPPIPRCFFSFFLSQKRQDALRIFPSSSSFFFAPKSLEWKSFGNQWTKKGEKIKTRVKESDATRPSVVHGLKKNIKKTGT